MAIDAEQLKAVATIAYQAETLRDAIAAMREAVPGIRASTVDAFDMRAETPLLRIGARDLFLMHSDGHCWSVTADPAEAAGIVLTQND